MSTRITFLGAAGTVTGSTYLVEHDDTQILVDCGLFQGPRIWRERNWNSPAFDPTKISSVILTHAHIDHIGMLPRYFSKGLTCPVLASPATAELAPLLLADSGRLHEEEAFYRTQHGKSRHSPPLPLYTEEDARKASKLIRSVPINKQITVSPNITAEWKPMGHILGACSIQLRVNSKLITFSGDIGRYDQPILVDPQPQALGELLLVESTYGDRYHNSSTHPRDGLQRIITETANRGGVVVIPSFAVGRTQTLLYYIRELKTARMIPDIPVIVDSPMARDATAIYQRHTSEYDSQASELLKRGFSPFTPTKMHFIRDRNESIALNKIDQPMILISASGMLSGGRILHHLKHRIGDPRNTVLFVGYQPPESRGDWILQGNKSVRLFGDEFPIRAEIAEISGLSAHADLEELLRWCKSCSGFPKKVAITHGEPSSARHFGKVLQEELSWNTVVPNYLDSITV